MINCVLIGLLSGDGWEKAKDVCRRVYSAEAVAPTITTFGGGREVKIAETANALPTAQKDNMVCEPKRRIRKLTPRECWRLMDFDDEDFERAAAENSKTQLYKQAGNSIVVNCLVAILGQMIEGKENVYKERKEPKP